VMMMMMMMMIASGHRSVDLILIYKIENKDDFFVAYVTCTI
jgi:hypothetical protein